jgi:nitrite reductase/ring-hydroxylating ferredoxin subunit
VSDYVFVGFAREFPLGRGRLVDVHGSPVAVFRTRRGFVAVSDPCPHMGASLSAGRLVESGQLVECSWHGWRYDTRTGANPSRPWARVAVYEVRIEGEKVFLRPTESPRGRPDPPSEPPWERFDPDRHLHPKKKR